MLESALIRFAQQLRLVVVKPLVLRFVEGFIVFLDSVGETLPNARYPAALGGDLKST